MGLPLYLAMTGLEMEQCASLPPYPGWFSAGGGAALPESLPPGALLILTDRVPFSVTWEWLHAAAGLDCCGVLLDFERPPSENTRALVPALAEALPCPVAAPPGYCDEPDFPVFLPPCPLHVPLADYLRPWRGREIWLEAALLTQTITVTARGTVYAPLLPAKGRADGAFDETLKCRCTAEISDSQVRFTLFDTPETLEKKLAEAAALGVGKAVGLWQELRNSR